MEGTTSTFAGHFEYLIIGAGPAGIQMGYFMRRGGRDYVILEASDSVASFFRWQPRHRKLLSINKIHNPFPELEYNMRHDWNSLLSDDPELRFQHYSKELYPNADDLVRYLEDFVKKCDLNIQFNCRVLRIDREGTTGRFTIETSDDRHFTCGKLIMATGVHGECLPTSVRGIDLCDTYSTHDIDREKYAGKTVCILGRGNSAFEVANHLAPAATLIHVFGEKKLKFAWDSHFVGDLRAINNTILDMYQLKSLHAYQAYTVKEVSKMDDGPFLVVFEDLVAQWKQPGRLRLSASYDHVIVCTGFNYCDTSLFADKIKPATWKEGKYPTLTHQWESSVPDMFYIGTAMQSIDKKSASGFIHGFRYNIRTLYHIMMERYENTPYPSTEVSVDLESISDTIINRLSIGDAIYQMSNFLCDVLVLPSFEPGSKATYYRDLPIQYVMEQEKFKKEEHVFTIVLRYDFDRFGEEALHANEFVHIPDFTEISCSPFIHPSIAHYSKGVKIEETDFLESLILRFDVKEFVESNGERHRNRVKNLFNKVTNLAPGVTFPEYVFDEEEYKKVFTPLTDEEIKNIPPQFLNRRGCGSMAIDLLEPICP